MQEQNKNNLYFLLSVFGAAIVLFFTIVMLTYLAEARGLWSAIIPVIVCICGVVDLIKVAIKYKKKMEDGE